MRRFSRALWQKDPAAAEQKIHRVRGCAALDEKIFL
jgi:hypothetical protein